MIVPYHNLGGKKSFRADIPGDSFIDSLYLSVVPEIPLAGSLNPRIRASKRRHLSLHPAAERSSKAVKCESGTAVKAEPSPETAPSSWSGPPLMMIRALTDSAGDPITLLLLSLG
jgi:hypothetical protein